MTRAQALQCSPRLLKAQRLQIQGRGIGGLVPQDSLDHAHGLPQPVQDARGQMTDGMEAERPYPCPFAQRPHEAHPLFSGHGPVVIAFQRVIQQFQQLAALYQIAPGAGRQFVVQELAQQLQRDVLVRQLPDLLQELVGDVRPARG